MKVSLILTTYNCADNLKKTLSSISAQDYTDIEVIVKDGGSTDGTVDIIREYASSHTNVIWKSAPDGGLYDALNIGIQMASGDVIAICNDLLAKETVITEYVEALTKHPDCIGAHSDLYYLNDAGDIVRSWKMGEGKIETGWMPGHPTLYLRKEAYEKYGLYNTTFKCSADYEFMIRVLKDETEKLVYIPEVMIHMFYGGTSTNGLHGYWVSLVEGIKALRMNQVKRPILITVKRILKVLSQFRI